MSHAPSLAERLRARIPEITSLWEARVREHVRPAQHQAAPALIDSLPDFLEQLARTLAHTHPPATEKAKQAIAREHGHQRASLVGYSADQILREYSILRATLLEVLEWDGVLPVEARDRLLDSVDNAMRLTALEFIEVQEAALREADARKNRFLYTLAHELRTPLSAITNATYILDQVGSPEAREARQRAIILRQAARLSRLVSDLTEVSHIVRGQLKLRKERVNLTVVVQNAAESSRPFIDDADHQLFCELEPDPVCIEGDADRLEQVVSNLLNNAARYTDPGGEIRVRLSREGDEAVLRVADTGRGIAPEMLPRVFDQYLQLDPEAPASRSGLGLGLTLVRHLVEGHGGSVEGSSPGLGQGAEFTVRLPLVPES